MNQREEINEFIALLIIGQLQGTNSKKESENFTKWLNASDENREYFHAIKASWVLSDSLSEKKRFDDNILWNKFQRRLNEPGKLKVPVSGNKFNYSHALRIAASWLIIFLLGSSVTYFITKQVSGRTGNTIVAAPMGAKSNVVLPDGSSVWLNADSKLEYSADFNSDTREVKLTGEGFFDIATNRSKPFVVHTTAGITINAYGTKFNVKAYPEENKVITTLVEGNVKITGKDEQENPFEIAMKPKQKITYYIDEKTLLSNEDITKTVSKKVPKLSKDVHASLPSIPLLIDENVKTELHTSWKDSRWIIEGENFNELAKMLERRYNTTISLTSGELKKYRFSGTIENETLEQVFEILQMTIPIHYSLDPGKVNVKLDRELREKYKKAY